MRLNTFFFAILWILWLEGTHCIDGKPDVTFQSQTDIDNLLKLGRAQDAMNIIEKLSPDTRRLPSAQIQVARAMMQLGQKIQGEKILKTVLQNDPMNLDARIVLGKYYVFQQQWPSAQQMLQQVLKLDPNHATAMVFLAKCAANSGDSIHARELVQKAAILAPLDENIQFELGMSHLAHNDPASAKKAFDEAARLNPKLDRGMLARVYMHYQQIEWAVVELESVSEKLITSSMTATQGALPAATDADFTNLLLLAESYDMLGYPTEALDMYYLVLSLEPENVLAHTGAGLLLLGTGTRNFAALNACGLNQQAALQHLTAGMNSQTARGQNANAIRNAQQLAERAASWCRTEKASASTWTDLCAQKRRTLLSSLKEREGVLQSMRVNTAAAAAAAVSSGVPRSKGFSIGSLHKAVVAHLLSLVRTVVRTAGLCPRWLIQFSWLAPLGRVCHASTSATTATGTSTGIAVSMHLNDASPSNQGTARSGTIPTRRRQKQGRSDASLPAEGRSERKSRDQILCEANSNDSAKIAQMKQQWRSREGMASIPRVTISDHDQGASEGQGSALPLSAAQFLQQFILKNKPAILTNMQTHWGRSTELKTPSREIFSTAGLVGSFGNNTVTVSVSQHGRFDGPESGELWGLASDVDVLVRPPTTSMQMVDFLALQGAADPSVPHATYYLEYLALHQYLGSDFMELIPLPESIQRLVRSTRQKSHPPSSASSPLLVPLVSNLWIGGSPTISPLHYDDYENFLAQIRGYKELVLFPPEDLEYLYYVGRPKGMLKFDYPATFEREAGSLDKRGFVFGSSVNVDAPDYDKHPLYAKAHPMRVILHPGDTLYLPSYWHHEVQSIGEQDHSAGDSRQINVAVNFWYANATSPAVRM